MTKKKTDTLTPAERVEVETLEANVVREEAAQAATAAAPPEPAVAEPVVPEVSPVVSEAPVERTWWGGVKK